MQSVLYSENPSGAVYSNVIGPVKKGKGAVRYIQCIVNSATRRAQATKHRTTSSLNLLKGMGRWMQKLGQIGILITDNTSYYESEEVDQWCKDNGVEK